MILLAPIVILDASELCYTRTLLLYLGIIENWH